jgi:hypothetical protein
VLVEHASRVALLPPLAALALVVAIMLPRHANEERTEAMPGRGAGSRESDSTFG